MPLHDDLLVLARSLVPQYVPSYPAAPAEANLRRGVSTAYYALFHLIVGEAMIRIVADPALRSRVARSFQHDKLQQVCQEYSRARLDNAGQLTMRSGAVIPVQLQDLGTAFVSLQNARHQADYDTGTTLTHEGADTQVLTAEAAFLDWDAIQANPAAAVFLTEILPRQESFASLHILTRQRGL